MHSGQYLRGPCWHTVPSANCHGSTHVAPVLPNFIVNSHPHTRVSQGFRVCGKQGLCKSGMRYTSAKIWVFCVLLKRVTKNPFNYFTNPKASYYLKPSMTLNVLIQFLQLVKLAKPSKQSKCCLVPKQKAELQQCASVHGKGVCQNTTRNYLT